MISFSLTLHILSGFGALISGCIAILSRKGERWHIAAGRVFTGSMVVIAVTAVHLSLASENSFLLFISIFSFYLAWSGFLAIHWKNRRPVKGLHYVNVFLMGTMFLLGCTMIVIPVAGWFGVTIPSGLAKMSTILLVFGIVLAALAGRDLIQLANPPVDEYSWLYRHIGRMGGAYIATCTAFLVVNITFLPDLILWLGPAFIGSPFIAWGIRRSRRLYVS